MIQGHSKKNVAGRNLRAKLMWGELSLRKHDEKHNKVCEKSDWWNQYVEIQTHWKNIVQVPIKAQQNVLVHWLRKCKAFSGAIEVFRTEMFMKYSTDFYMCALKRKLVLPASNLYKFVPLYFIGSKFGKQLIPLDIRN